MTVETRVEKHVIRPSHQYYGMLSGFCRKSKDLYNHGNYIVRQAFTKKSEWVRYGTLDKLLRADTDFPDYIRMPTAQSAQQTLRMLDSAWKGFFTAIKDWKQHPDKYLGRPKLPKYLKKEGLYCLTLTNQNCKIRDGLVYFPKVFDGFTVNPKFLSDNRFVSFQQARFIPRPGHIVLELVYKIEISDERLDNGRYIGIDIGVDNLAAVANTWGGRPFIINGRPLKAMNQYVNKEKAHYQSVLEQTEGRKGSKRLAFLMTKHGRKIDDYLHKASRFIVSYCLENNVSRIIIGRNKEWKQGSGLGKRANQNFVQLPFWHFIWMLSYKAKEHGITVILTEESYTSGTSFLDDEDPVKTNYDKTRRIKRGLFKANDGTLINADINGAFQIIKKVVPIKWDRGCVLHPAMVSPA